MEAKEKLDRFSREVMSESSPADEGGTVGLESEEGVRFIRVILGLDCPRFLGQSQSSTIP
jgi:hypothetical protein